MKKRLAAFLLLLPLLPLFALRSGDKMRPPEDVKWLRGSLPEPVERDAAGRTKYRIFTFLLTHAANSPETVMMLNGLASRDDVAGIAVITPDPAVDAEAFLERLPKTAVSFGADRSRRTTGTYMAGSILFPMAFVIDPDGLIVWNGEAVDLPEFLDSLGGKPADVSRQRRISEKLDELQTLMRGNEPRRMRHLADEIFRLDPGNAPALRMMLFVLESSGRIPEAWEILSGQLAAAPRKARIYYAALDMISRHAALGKELPGVVGRFAQNVKSPDAYDILVWTLLERFAFDAAALEGAVRLYEAGGRLQGNAGRSPASAAGRCAAGALLAARLGQFARAAGLQRQAARHWRAAGSASAAENAERTASFFELCGKTSVRW